MTSICPDPDTCDDRPRSGRHVVDVHTDRCWPVDERSRVSHRQYYLDIGEAIAGWGGYHGDSAKTSTGVGIVNRMAADHGGIDEIFVPTNANKYVAVRFHADNKVGVYISEPQIGSIDRAPDERLSADTDANGYHQMFWPGYGRSSSRSEGTVATRPVCACQLVVTADGQCTLGICDGAPE